MKNKYKKGDKVFFKGDSELYTVDDVMPNSNFPIRIYHINVYGDWVKSEDLQPVSVTVKSNKEWNEVYRLEGMPKCDYMFAFGEIREGLCININNQKSGTWGDVAFYVEEGYKVITFKQYLEAYCPSEKEIGYNEEKYNTMLKKSRKRVKEAKRELKTLKQELRILEELGKEIFER